MKFKYNALVNSKELQLEIFITHLQNLAEIFVKYNVYKRLKVYLIYSYAKLAISNIMLSYSLIKPSGL